MAPASAAKAHHRLILAPKQGRRLPARPVVIKVRAPRGAKHFRVRLNGHSVGRYFSQPRHRVRRLRASLCYGLRHGHNRLRVRVGKRTQRSGFRVRGDRSLVCAGFNRTTSVGARLRLTGRHRAAPRGHRRPLPGGFSAKRPGGAKYKWKVIKAPKTTETQPVGELKRHGHSATFKPALPGRYTLRLSVTTGARGKASGKASSGGTTASDTTDLTVLPNPQAPIVTMSHDDAGNWGVDVGSGSAVQFYSNHLAGSWVQLVALDARTLALVSNQSIPCPEATTHPYATDLAAVQRCTTELRNDIAALKAKAQPPSGAGEPLDVIVVSQPPDEGQPDASDSKWKEQPPVGVLESLVPLGIGAPVVWQNTDTPMLRGTVSVIGHLPLDVPPTYHTSRNLTFPQTGEISGSLLADNQSPKLFSTFVSPEQATYETQAPGSTATSNVMRINGQSYSASVPPGQGGFQMTILQRSDLSRYRNDVVGFNGSGFFQTHGNSIGQATGSLDVMRYLIETADTDTRGQGGALVFITSVGNPQLLANPAVNDSAKKFVDTLQNTLGASRIRVYRALDPALASNWSYSLIAATGHTPRGQALEAEGAQTASGLNGVPLSGHLDRSSTDYGYEVESDAIGDQLGSPGQKLHDLAFDVPTDDWPERAPGCKAVPNGMDPQTLDNDGCAAAVNWIATRMLGDTNRGLFWTQPYTKEFWDGKITAISKCTYKGSSTCNYTGSASAADFKWAQDELEQEVGWLEAVNGYVNTLAKPFADSLVMLTSDKDNVASKIENLSQADSSDHAEVKVGLFLNGIKEGALGIAAEIPGVGVAAESMNAAISTALEWGKVEGGEAGNDFQVTAGEVGSTLATSLEAALKTLQQQLPDLIAADYGKLKTLGICSQVDTSTCPDAGEWQITQPDQTAAETLVRNSIRTSLFTALLPAQYTAWRLPISPNHSVNWQGSQIAGQDFTGWHCPFHGSPNSANFSYPVAADFGNPGGPNDQWQVIAYGKETGAGSLDSYFKMAVPQARATDPLFQPVGKGSDGLGIGLTSAEPFYWQAFGNAGTDPFDHFPLTSSSTAWITSSTPGIKDSNCGY